MRSVDVHEAKAHFSRLLDRVGKGESIIIKRRGRPVAALSPAQPVKPRDIAAVIAEFRAYSREQARKRGSLSAKEIKKMIKEGRP